MERKIIISKQPRCKTCGKPMLERNAWASENIMDEVKMFLFARWIAICYADEHLDGKMRYTDNEDFDGTTAMSVLNRETGHWYKKQLKHFNDVVYPNYIKNGTVDNTKQFFNIC